MVKKWIDKMKNWYHPWRWNLLVTIGAAFFLAWLVKGCMVISDLNKTEKIWQKRSSIQVFSQNYQDEAGNEIVYYCCKTTYYGEDLGEIMEASGGGAQTETVSQVDERLDRNAVMAVVDLDQAAHGRNCQVGEWPAYLCQVKDRTYLCWTISPEYSCVIAYDAQTVEEEDIFRMAESVVQQP